MNQVWLYSISSVFLISLVSLAGIFFLGIKPKKLQKILIYLVSFSAGALFGDAFIHLFPEIIKGDNYSVFSAVYILGGILLFFVLEKFVHWKHCHDTSCEEHVYSFAYMNLLGDGVHNFIDGLIIAGSYIVSIPVGIATTLAVLMHEIPQEIGDFGVMLYAGFSKWKALGLHFLTSLTAIIGTVIGLWMTDFLANSEMFLISLAIGGFLYIAGSDLIPELHKHTEIKSSAIQIIAFILGIVIMLLLLLLE